MDTKNNLKVRLLMFREFEKSNTLKKYGALCFATDFAIIQGILCSEGFRLNDLSRELGLIADYWIIPPKGCNSTDQITFIDGSGEWSECGGDDRATGTRPVVEFMDIYGELSKPVNYDDIIIAEYGKYPQSFVGPELNDKLEKLFKNDLLMKTGNSYAGDKTIQLDDKFSLIRYLEYEYEGERYIRIMSGEEYEQHEIINKSIRVQPETPYWIKVEPIKWIIDSNLGLAISEKVLFSNIQFLSPNTDYDNNFENTNIYEFLNKYFAKEIVPENMYEYAKSNLQQPITRDVKKIARKVNPYDFDYSYISEEDIIKGGVLSGISVFLHGRSSDGKSARVKQIDPDCEIIYMRNATPESLNGKSVYNSNTGEMIDVKPSWLRKIEEKCEREPNKIHIIFFDELTNALPSIQGMAFNIILDGEVNGKWKLPDNARIVAAGNDMNDSLAANQMAEPLFNRFAHVYINTTTENWLKWAVTPEEQYQKLDYRHEKQPSKIHPAILAYIMYRSKFDNDALRTKFTGEKPNADPRKWEMASKMLYKTNNPNMLRALIGEDLTQDFINFTNHQVISIEDVINGNYTEADLEMNISEMYITAIVLSAVDDEHFEIVRDFIKKLGPELRALFELMWAHGDENRMERISELIEEEKAKVLTK